MTINKTKSYLLNYLALLSLLALTLFTARQNLASLNTPLALIIAAAKASLIALYFMHLNHTSRLTKLAALAALLWLLILFLLTLSDYQTRALLTLKPHSTPLDAIALWQD